MKVTFSSALIVGLKVSDGHSNLNKVTNINILPRVFIFG